MPRQEAARSDLAASCVEAWAAKGQVAPIAPIAVLSRRLSALPRPLECIVAMIGSCESSTWRRAANSLMAHQFILEGMLARLLEERQHIDPDHIEELIRHDVVIRRVERDLRTVEARLSRMG